MIELGEITTHSQTAESFAARFKSSADALEKNGDKKKQANYFTYSTSSSVHDLGSFLNKMKQATNNIGNSIETDSENLLKINQTFIEQDQKDRSLFGG